jgi:acyl-[acyl-carrier-protein] desaturase
MSRDQRARHIERAVYGLYRWYTNQSQIKRGWQPDTSFDWRNIRKDHHPDVIRLLQGYFAVEQYIPDFTSKGLNLLRRSWGRSQFQLKWGSEEAKHADLWQNALLFAGGWSREQMDDYTDALRESTWELPFEDSYSIIMYTVFQELATRLNYANLGLIARGKGRLENPQDHVDPVLAEVCATIATDEAAHYGFYLEVARVLLYYDPVHALESLHDVLSHFSMPAQGIIPNWLEIQESILRLGVYNHKEFAHGVLRLALEQLTPESKAAVRKGIQRLRMVPDCEGKQIETIATEVLDVPRLRARMHTAFGRVAAYERRYGLDEVDPTELPEGPLEAFIAASDDEGLR